MIVAPLVYQIANDGATTYPYPKVGVDRSGKQDCCGLKDDINYNSRPLTPTNTSLMPLDTGNESLSLSTSTNTSMCNDTNTLHGPSGEQVWSDKIHYVNYSISVGGVQGTGGVDALT